MIVEFSMGNYRSFNKMQTLSFRATGLVSEDRTVDEKNMITINGINYLKIAGIYGANGSGKSNVLEAFLFFNQMIISSIIIDQLPEITMNPFRFSEESHEDAGFFQIILLLNGNKYRYGFSISKVGTIQAEWLFGPAERNETYYFKRTIDSENIEINSEYFKEGYNLPKDKLKNTSLFITFCASYDGPVANALREYFRKNVTIEGITRYPIFINSRVSRNFERETDILIAQGQKDLVLTWLKEAGMCYEDIEIDMANNERKRNRVFLFKNTYNPDGTIAGTNRLDLDRDESEGSKKFYDYIGKLLRKFNEGGLFVADEIDNNFHPSLLKKLISLFQDQRINKAGAQLLFTSHDTNLMNPDYMRRDQFYFAEKTLLEETKLYSLSDLKGIRNNADFAKQYLSGAYGAVPMLGNYLEEQEN